MSVYMQVWFLQVPMPPLMPFLLMWAGWSAPPPGRGPRAGSRGAEGHREATRAPASALDAVRGGPPWSDQAGPIPRCGPGVRRWRPVGTPAAGQQLDSAGITDSMGCAIRPRHAAVSVG